MTAPTAIDPGLDLRPVADGYCYCCGFGADDGPLGHPGEPCYLQRIAQPLDPARHIVLAVREQLTDLFGDDAQIPPAMHARITQQVNDLLALYGCHVRRAAA